MPQIPKTRPPKLPNFIVAGAPTSGTTSLYHYLRQHPQVFMCPIKEPTYFAAADILARDDLRPMLERQRPALRAYLAGEPRRPEQVWVTEWDDYVQLFKNARDETALGEASVSYLWLPSAAPAIRARLPVARLIFLLRDPTERLFSAYLMSRAEHPNVSFRDWVGTAMNSADDRRRRMPQSPTPIDGGLYATHLRRFLELFPREQVRIYLYEDYRADARAVLGDIFAFLGVDPIQPIDVSRRHNETVVPRFPAMDRLRHRIFGHAPLTAWLPAPVSRALRGFYNRGKGNFTMDPEDRQRVIDYYRDELLQAQDLISRDLATWLR